ncbi:nuclear transport factor 2 family protein [Phenylobacterium sp. LjRoot225]|uniref:nuclear transport factor 2 family protein n=1 Tax=Phenylobacterium sp. LjRoot225 TaxID=3342285 RepID=UPI003ECCD701
MTAAGKLSNVDLIQAQLEAYNAQDLDAYCAYFADDIQVGDLNRPPHTSDIETYRKNYAGVFAKFPENKAELLNRIAVGSTVIDHEKVIRSPGGETFEVIAIYTIADGKVARVDFVK